MNSEAFDKVLTFEANTVIWIFFCGRTKNMLIRKQIITFKRSRYNVREIIIGRNFFGDKFAADMKDSMDYFSDSN
uniref:Uncharacterized protein n=1 Tax=Rhizophagus irregularis (strain DAOM 181602 / DAOM 197198 / MUCL 43194) TaxID=747089 RepID=U9UB70_RHIID